MFVFLFYVGCIFSLCTEDVIAFIKVYSWNMVLFQVWNLIWLVLISPDGCGHWRFEEYTVISEHVTSVCKIRL